jgi:DNA-binding response OmpR family regulator
MSADGRQPHILIINDTQEILDLMQELLEDEGYRVTTSWRCSTLPGSRRWRPT